MVCSSCRMSWAGERCHLLLVTDAGSFRTGTCRLFTRVPERRSPGAIGKHDQSFREVLLTHILHLASRAGSRIKTQRKSEHVRSCSFLARLLCSSFGCGRQPQQGAAGLEQTQRLRVGFYAAQLWPWSSSNFPCQRDLCCRPGAAQDAAPHRKIYNQPALCLIHSANVLIGQVLPQLRDLALQAGQSASPPSSRQPWLPLSPAGFTSDENSDV